MKILFKKFWVAAICAVTFRAYSLTIIPTFDSTITGDPNAAAMETAISNAIAVLESKVANNQTVYITFVQGSSGLGESDTYYTQASYSSYLSALRARATSVNDSKALSKLPNSSTDPVIGGSTINLQLPLAILMGLYPQQGSSESTITINMAICNLSRPPGNSSKYDLQQVTEHEMDEVLGTPSELPDTSSIRPPDLFRYTTNLARTFTTSGDNSYFSADGTNLIARYNMNSGGDYGDWWSYTSNWAPPGQTPHVQVQDAFTPPNTQVDVGVSELTLLDIIGWTLTSGASVVASTNPPTLKIVRSAANQYTLSWTNTATGFVLQERTNLLTGAWANSSTGSTNPAVITSSSLVKFYRLYEAAAPLVLTSPAVTDQTTKARMLPSLKVFVHKTNPRSP